MMNTLVYDGSFEGMCCALKRALELGGDAFEIISEDRAGESLFQDTESITSDKETAEHFLREMEMKYSGNTARHISMGYLSDIEGIETLLLRYLSLGGKLGRSLNRHQAEPAVLDIQKISAKVGFEAHRLTGLIRFRKLPGGEFYAPIEPDHNILALLVPHFRSRFGNQKWIIHDLKRGWAVLYNGKNWTMAEISLNHDGLLKDAGASGDYYEGDERSYQELWKTYYKAVAIEERRNPRLQKRCMPVRYWKYLIEKQ